ncbi:unnamed protein product [Orchesella dallaii]|uniref:PPM-type phosphatase domain-containing protein n=1 Tax=Orchesella dallaii TaxID=48710 RepID=A0ABP1S8W4_9HEXA
MDIPMDSSQTTLKKEMFPEQAQKDTHPARPPFGSIINCTVHKHQGDREHMEDKTKVVFDWNAPHDELDDKYDNCNFAWAFFGLFDGHGGRQAASYARKYLMHHIVSHPHFDSDEDDLVLQAITEGFVSLHNEMAEKRKDWPKSLTGHPSVCGTTASVVFIKNGKVFIGHVGDSAIVLGYQDPTNNSQFWSGKQLTVDHKPDSPVELKRIENCGGKVVRTKNVSRVVWYKPKSLKSKKNGMDCRHVEQVPFLNMARSLGDFWSYNPDKEEYAVSPVPDTMAITLDPDVHRCLILGSDGLWNVMAVQNAVNVVYSSEMNNSRRRKAAEMLGKVEKASASDTPTRIMMKLIDPAARLVRRAVDEWAFKKARADNVSAIVILFR